MSRSPELLQKLAAEERDLARAQLLDETTSLLDSLSNNPKDFARGFRAGIQLAITIIEASFELDNLGNLKTQQG